MAWKKIVLPILVAILVILGTALTASARPRRAYRHYGRVAPPVRVYPRYPPAYRYYSRPYYVNPYTRPYYPAYPYTTPYGYPYASPYPYYVQPYPVPAPGFGVGGPNWSLRFGF